MMTRLPLLLALIAGCESLEDRAKYLTGPDVIEWQSNDRFTVTGQDDMRGSVNLSQGILKVYLSGFPPATKFTLGDQSMDVRDNGAADLETEMTPFFGSISTADFLRGKVEGASLELQAPGQPAFTVVLPPRDALMLEIHLASVKEGPLLYVGEQATAVPTPKTIHWYHGASNDLVGVQATHLAGIDAIAITEEVTAGTRICPGYQAGDGSERDLTLRLTDHVVTVYDRRTGTPLVEHSFPPIDRCPGSTFTMQGQAFETQTVLPEDDIRAWLTEQVAG